MYWQASLRSIGENQPIKTIKGSSFVCLMRENDKFMLLLNIVYLSTHDIIFTSITNAAVLAIDNNIDEV